nr:ABC transporter substrate-binding protein [Paenibacillus phyllosphaerae]
MQRNPDVQVVLRNEQPEAAELWSDQAQLGLASDIYLMENERIIDFAVKGYLRQMDDFYTGDRLNEQLKALTESLKWNNSIWGVPVDADPSIIVWHNGLLARAGLNRPPRSYEELVAVTEKLLTEDPSISPVGVELQDGRAVQTWLGAFAEIGGTVRDLEALDGNAVKRLQYLTTNSNGADSNRQLEERLHTGKLLSAVMPWSEYVRLSAELHAQLRIDEEASHYIWTGGRSFVVSSQSEEQEAALRWLGAMTESIEQQSRYSVTGRLPALNAIYRNQYDRGDVVLRPPYTMLAVMTKAAYSPVPDWWAKWQRWSSMWHQVDNSGLTEEGVQRIVAQWNQFLAKS